MIKGLKGEREIKSKRKKCVILKNAEEVLAEEHDEDRCRKR